MTGLFQRPISCTPFTTCPCRTSGLPFVFASKCRLHIQQPLFAIFSGSHFTCMFGGAIRVCYSNPVHWCASSRYADYTNNPMMYSRLWLLQHLGDQFAGFQCFCCRSCIFVNIWFTIMPTSSVCGVLLRASKLSPSQLLARQ